MTTDQRDRDAETPDTRLPLMPEVLLALTSAVARRRASRRRRIATRGAGLAIAAVLISGSALAATGQWNPLTGSGSRSYTYAPPPGDQTDVLAVLRRPQDNADRGPLMTAFLHKFQRGRGQVNVRYVRFLRDAETTMVVGTGGTWIKQTTPAILVLFPRVRREALNRGSAPKLVHSLCMDFVSDSWPAGAAPPILDTIRPGGGQATTPVRPPLLEDRITGGGTCILAHHLRTKGIALGDFSGGSIAGLVPDGVATVRARTEAGQTISQRVVNNSFQLLAPGRNEKTTGANASGLPTSRNGQRRFALSLAPPSGRFKHQTLEWVAADGTVIRHLSQ